MAPGFHLATLGVQHRMHPDISSIIRLATYNDLVDAPKVISHPEPLGLLSRVIFVNHGSHEDEQNVDALESVSKTNAHERAMIVKTVQYLLKQGYVSDDIVVLTPYLGQMMKLHADLGECVGATLDERDLNEAREQFRGDDNFSEDLAASKQQISKADAKSAIRVATIDNYQGEEAKIVLISLVRSNEMGQIGFLKEPERVNVMLSRARECKIIFGNRATLELAKGTLSPLKGGSLWKKIFSHLESSGHLFDGLPVVCQNHSSRALLSCPNDFDRYCSDGGCAKKCLKEHAECGHPCQRLCHPGPCPKCPIICLDVCTRGLEMKKRCSAEMLPKCNHVITWTCLMGHVASGPCFQGKFGSDCKICNGIREEEESRIKREEVLNNELNEKQHWLEEVKSKLEEAKQSKIHQRELKDIENELALAQKELDSFLDQDLESNSQMPMDAEEIIDSTIVLNNVLTLLQKHNEIPLSEFPRVYRDEFESVFVDDAAKWTPHKSKKRRKLVEVLQCMSFCEIVPGKKSVRLRDENKKAQTPQKAIKLDSDHVVESDDTNPVTANAVSSTRNPENVFNTSIANDDVTPAGFTPPSNHNLVLSSSSVANLIVPPMPTTKSLPINSEEDTILHVLRRYNAEGSLKADNLLDEISIKSYSIDALRFMFEIELNSGGKISAPPYKPTSSNLINALLLTARAFDLSKKYPLQARDLAQMALSFIEGMSTKSSYPMSWVADLKSIDRPTLNPRPPASYSNKVSNTLSEAWAEVERNDPTAPKVMSDSILPMVGLEAVKESLLSMYL